MNAADRRFSVEAFGRSGFGDQLNDRRRFEQIIGNSPALEAVLEQVEQIGRAHV